METVLLAGRTTSRLGFGGSTLGNHSSAEAKRLIAVAFDVGIRHFDVAPMYAFGRSEQLLHQALGDNLQYVTVTTKYGLAAPKHGSWIGPIHRFARTTLAAFPRLRERMRGPATETPGHPLTAAEADASIGKSLRNLHRDSIDVLLLHEATPERLTDPGLLDVLQRHKEAGRLREFGIGSRRDRALACLRERSAFCPLVQCEWSVFTEVASQLDGRARIVHGSMNGPRDVLRAWLFSEPARYKRWSDSIGVDLNDDGMLARLLLKASLEYNTGHIVLFSASTTTRIHQNVVTAEDRSLEQPARTFRTLVQQEFLRVCDTATTKPPDDPQAAPPAR